MFGGTLCSSPALNSCHLHLFVCQSKCEMITAALVRSGLKETISAAPAGSLSRQALFFPFPPFSQFVLIFHRESEQHDSNQEMLQQRRWCNNFTACLLMLQPAPATALNMVSLAMRPQYLRPVFCETLIFNSCHVTVMSQAVIATLLPTQWCAAKDESQFSLTFAKSVL